ncbi:MAG: hypothetical protein ACK4RK_00385 [Gemmataceae bacterium]
MSKRLHKQPRKRSTYSLHFELLERRNLLSFGFGSLLNVTSLTAPLAPEAQTTTLEVVDTANLLESVMSPLDVEETLPVAIISEPVAALAETISEPITISTTLMETTIISIPDNRLSHPITLDAGLGVEASWDSDLPQARIEAGLDMGLGESLLLAPVTADASAHLGTDWTVTPSEALLWPSATVGLDAGLTASENTLLPLLDLEAGLGVQSSAAALLPVVDLGAELAVVPEEGSILPEANLTAALHVTPQEDMLLPAVVLVGEATITPSADSILPEIGLAAEAIITPRQDSLLPALGLESEAGIRPSEDSLLPALELDAGFHVTPTEDSLLPQFDIDAEVSIIPNDDSLLPKVDGSLDASIKPVDNSLLPEVSVDLEGTFSPGEDAILPEIDVALDIASIDDLLSSPSDAIANLLPGSVVSIDADGVAVTHQEVPPLASLGTEDDPSLNDGEGEELSDEEFELLFAELLNADAAAANDSEETEEELGPEEVAALVLPVFAESLELIGADGEVLAIGVAADLLAGLGLDWTSVEQMLDHFLQLLAELQEMLSDWLLGQGWLPWLMALGLAAAVAEWYRRHLRRSKADMDMALACSAAAWPWLPGMQGLCPAR